MTPPDRSPTDLPPAAEPTTEPGQAALVRARTAVAANVV
jgi:hypothetical protein